MDKTLGGEIFHNQGKNSSFSSSLLDKIYRSIDEGDTRSIELKFHRETMGKKQNRGSVKYNRDMKEVEELAASTFRQSCLLDKWMEKEASEKLGAKLRYSLNESDRTSQRHRQHVDYDQDIRFFSSTSSSSDSSSGGFSSSDTESVYRMKPPTTCFGPLRPKPVRTTVPARSLRSEKVENDESQLKKFRDLKIYSNLKKMKHPNSPGGRLTSFLNSLFTTGNTKKTKTTSCVGGGEDSNAGRRIKSSQDSTCSSASSFSRSCLSNHSPALREKLRNGVNRTVRFYPVSVIVDEDSQACGHKCLYEEDKDSSLLSVSVPAAWKIGRSPSGKNEDELKLHMVEKSRQVEAPAKEFLKDYHENQKKNDLILKNLLINTMLQHAQNDNDEGDEDAASCSSSDLFELDHLSVMENHRYYEELPVYGTTHVGTNRV